jgi:hypothetical protein
MHDTRAIDADRRIRPARTDAPVYRTAPRAGRRFAARVAAPVGRAAASRPRAGAVDRLRVARHHR